MSQTNAVVVPDEVAMNKIYMVRDQKVMLDSDLAEVLSCLLYKKAYNAFHHVLRLRSQIVTSNYQVLLYSFQT